jgi:transposase InsO family protein
LTSEEERVKIIEVVKTTVERSGWTVNRVLKRLEVPETTYYRWLRTSGAPRSPTRWSAANALLDEERQAIVDYARSHPNPRHRELTWKMVDEGVAYASSTTVYHILVEENLIPQWKTDEREESRPRLKPTRPDERWATDITYVKVGERNYFLLTFIDEYSRYITHHELLLSMDQYTVSWAAQDAFSKLGDLKPLLISDNGPPFVSREFKRTLTYNGVGHQRIHPHTPEQNAICERSMRTIKDALPEELKDLEEARTVIAGIIDNYNNVRYHSSLGYVPPAVYYRGNPEAVHAERWARITAARHRRKEINLERRQATLHAEA